MVASGARSEKQLQFRSTVVGDYRLVALVGQGQYAQVYAATHRHTGRLVAIKQTRHTRESVSQEPQVMARLDHPNVVQVQAASKTELGYQLVLEYCEGGTLRSHLASTLDLPHTLPLTEVRHLIGNILRGLSHIHSQGIVHGDLKPENIFLTYQSHRSTSQQNLESASRSQLTLKIGDFGSARFISSPSYSRREIGSPTYAAPERFEGHTSQASDLYSAGVILYELLVGNRPFSGNPDTLKRAHQTRPVPLPPTLTFAARHLLKIALHKHPEHRFPTADHMLRALQNLTSATTSAQPPATLSHLSHSTLANPSHPFLQTVSQGPYRHS